MVIAARSLWRALLDPSKSNVAPLRSELVELAKEAQKSLEEYPSELE